MERKGGAAHRNWISREWPSDAIKLLKEWRPLMAARIKIRKYRRRPSLGATITSDSSSMFATNRIAESRSLRYIALSTVQKKKGEEEDFQVSLSAHRKLQTIVETFFFPQ